MSDSPSKAGRWVAAALAAIGLAAVFLNMLADNMTKGEATRIEGYTPWPEETIRAAETLPVQNGGRVKPLSTYAGFTMLGFHGARSMKVEDQNGNVSKLKPTAWMLDALFRPEFAIHEPTFRVDNSAVLESIGVKPKGRRDRYSYAEIEPGRDKLIELAKSYEIIESKKRDPMQQQIVDLAYNVNNYQSLLGYFGFARLGVVLKDLSGKGGPGQRAEISKVLMAVPEIRKELAKSQAAGTPIQPHVQALLEQVLDAANFAKYGLFILPPADPAAKNWQSAGNAIMNVMTEQSLDASLVIGDVAAMEDAAQSYAAGDEVFREKLVAMRDRFVARAEARGEYGKVELEAEYYRKNWFLSALVFFLVGTLSALGMWAFGRGEGRYSAGRILSWSTVVFSLLGLGCCVTAIVKRCVIMGRPPVGNLYDTVIFIAASVVILSLLLEWMTKRRFALGFAPILGTLLVVLARRYELGDAKDHMDPLVAVLDSNYWLTVHVITITLGYSAGLLSAFLSCGYVLLRGLRLDGGDKGLQRTITRIVYGCICLTLFLSLVGTVLGGIWANDSWGRFWGWDPKENGALLIVIWTLAILHARLGGYIREWGLHFASVFTACIVAFSWWHVNFLGVGLHNYGFTSGKDAIWTFYGVILAFLAFGVIAMAAESQGKAARKVPPSRPGAKPIATEG